MEEVAERERPRASICALASADSVEGSPADASPPGAAAAAAAPSAAGESLAPAGQLIAIACS